MLRTKFRSLTCDKTGQMIGAAGERRAYKMNLVNLHSAAVFFKFYNKVTAGTSSDVPVLTLRVPATSSLNVNDGAPTIEVDLGLSIRAVTGSADNDATDPGTLPIVEVDYN